MNVSNRSIPMTVNCIEKIYKKNSGPKEDTARHKTLEE